MPVQLGSLCAAIDRFCSHICKSDDFFRSVRERQTSLSRTMDPGSLLDGGIPGRDYTLGGGKENAILRYETQSGKKPLAPQ